MDVRSYRGAEGDTDHQLVITEVREKLCIANRENKGSKQLKFEVKRLNNPSRKADYQLELSNKFEMLADSSNNNGINNEIDVRCARQFVKQLRAQRRNVWVRRNSIKTNLGLMKNALSFMRHENKQGNDG